MVDPNAATVLSAANPSVSNFFIIDFTLSPDTSPTPTAHSVGDKICLLGKCTTEIYG